MSTLACGGQAYLSAAELTATAAWHSGAGGGSEITPPMPSPPLQGEQTDPTSPPTARPPAPTTPPTPPQPRPVRRARPSSTTPRPAIPCRRWPCATA
ncbi:MAG: hypothetical protein N3A60_03280 [Thermanaerothrix sp.]|nr:hypothetical protein [Thermanaerothrix sp.]